MRLCEKGDDVVLKLSRCEMLSKRDTCSTGCRHDDVSKMARVVSVLYGHSYFDWWGIIPPYFYNDDCKLNQMNLYTWKD